MLANSDRTIQISIGTEVMKSFSTLFDLYRFAFEPYELEYGARNETVDEQTALEKDNARNWISKLPNQRQAARNVRFDAVASELRCNDIDKFGRLLSKSYRKHITIWWIV